MIEAGAIGIVSIAMRDKNEVAIIRPQNDWLVMTVLNFPEQLKSFDVEPYKIPLTNEQVSAGLKFVENRIEAANLEQYKNTYIDNLMKIIKGDVLDVVVDKVPEQKSNAIEMFG